MTSIRVFFKCWTILNSTNCFKKVMFLVGHSKNNMMQMLERHYKKKTVEIYLKLTRYTINLTNQIVGF